MSHPHQTMSDIKYSSPFPSPPPQILLDNIEGLPGEQLRHGGSGLTALIKPLISPEHFALPDLGAKKTSQGSCYEKECYVYRD